jgi:hypothetical protein
MFESYVSNLVLSLMLGAAIGLERQSSRNLLDSGIRNFSLIGLLGCIASIFYVNNLPLVFGLMSAAFVILLSMHYVLASPQNNDNGFTTEIAKGFAVDRIVLDRDPIRTDPKALFKAEVVVSIFDGRVVNRSQIGVSQ